MTLFAVTIPGEKGHVYVYGPFDDANVAKSFADFASLEIDPARVVIMTNPVAEMLAWAKANTAPGSLVTVGSPDGSIVDTTGWAPGIAKAHAQVCKGGDFWRTHGEICICTCVPCRQARK